MIVIWVKYSIIPNFTLMTIVEDINNIPLTTFLGKTPTTMARRGGGCPLRGAEQGFHEVKTVEAIFVVGVFNI